MSDNQWMKLKWVTTIFLAILSLQLGACSKTSGLLASKLAGAGGAATGLEGIWSVCLDSSTANSFNMTVPSGSSLRLMIQNSATHFGEQLATYPTPDCSGAPGFVDPNASASLTNSGNKIGSILYEDLFYTEFHLGQPKEFFPLALSVSADQSNPFPMTLYVSDDRQLLCSVNGNKWSLSDSVPGDWNAWISDMGISDFVANPISVGQCLRATPSITLAAMSSSLTSYLGNQSNHNGARALTGTWSSSCVSNGPFSMSWALEISGDGSFVELQAAYGTNDCSGPSYYSVQSNGTSAALSLGQAAGWFPLVINPDSLVPAPETVFISADGSQLCYDQIENWPISGSAPQTWGAWQSAASIASFISAPTTDSNSVCLVRVSN